MFSSIVFLIVSFKETFHISSILFNFKSNSTVAKSILSSSNISIKASSSFCSITYLLLSLILKPMACLKYYENTYFKSIFVMLVLTVALFSASVTDIIS